MWWQRHSTDFSETALHATGMLRTCYRECLCISDCIMGRSPPCWVDKWMVFILIHIPRVETWGCSGCKSVTYAAIREDCLASCPNTPAYILKKITKWIPYFDPLTIAFSTQNVWHYLYGPWWRHRSLPAVVQTLRSPTIGVIWLCFTWLSGGVVSVL